MGTRVIGAVSPTSSPSLRWWHNVLNPMSVADQVGFFVKPTTRPTERRPARPAQTLHEPGFVQPDDEVPAQSVLGGRWRAPPAQSAASISRILGNTAARDEVCLRVIDGSLDCR